MQDPFQPFYARDEPAYGLAPSAELASALSQLRPSGRALDLGAGAGRDTLELARLGLDVTSVDLSSEGLRCLTERAAEVQLDSRITPVACDVRSFEIQQHEYQVIVATTVLDHIPPSDAEQLWHRMTNGLDDGGLLYVEVHNTDDPGCELCTSSDSESPKSETATWVINHFRRGQLMQWASACERLRVLRYEERYEWDYTHGPEHKHAKSILLATTSDADPPWYGHPIVFPRQLP